MGRTLAQARDDRNALTPSPGWAFARPMGFESRLTHLPRPFDPDRGEEAVAAIGLAPGPAAELVRGTAGSSPFLAGALMRETEWVSDILGHQPEEVLSRVLSETRSLEPGDLMDGLRRGKRRLALLTALADLGGIWSLEAVTGALTEFADLATDRALEAALAVEIRRGRLPERSLVESGLACLAMGKMGAGELNYSSDIDLILLYDDDLFEASEQGGARQAFVRVVRTAMKTLSDRTGEGYVFRTDLRLRPDAAVTPVVLSMEAAERYYESLGRTWERAAYIKARPAAGDLGAGQRFLETLRPFVWRRHLDFAAIQDAHDIRLRIRDSKGLHAEPSHLGHNLKLGRGGIREIEFFTQTRQLIAGGRDPELRVRGTVEALRRLSEANWLGQVQAEMLIEAYDTLRRIEHRVQMIGDQQTHDLPTTESEFRKLAFLDGRDAASLKDTLLSTFERVSDLTDEFFDPSLAPTEMPEISPEMAEIFGRWRSYPAFRSSRAQEIFGRVRPLLIERLKRVERPEEALRHLDGFLAGLPAGVQLFSLFEANPHLLDLIVDIAATAPSLAAYLSRNPGVFDAVIAGDFFTEWPGADGLASDLSEELDRLGDYERQLDRTRTWAREWNFRVGVHLLRGLIDVDTAGRQYADLAEAVLRALWPKVVDHFAEKHGPPPGRGAAVIGMGSLGAGRLNRRSDLDLIVIYDAAGEDMSEGRRPLASRTYYARLTQALVTALSAPTSEGRLYEVDMRLRPSGKQGPVATSLAAFETYQSEEAWTWEHLALTRARPVAGSEEIGAEIETIRRALLAQPRERATILADVADMRARLDAAKARAGGLDAKAGPGRLMEIELAAAAGTLLAGSPERVLSAQIAVAAQELDIDADLLRGAAACFRSVTVAVALVTEPGIAVEDISSGAANFIARQTGCDDLESLLADLDQKAAKVAAELDRAFGGPTHDRNSRC